MATYTAAYADVRINDNARFRTQMGWIGTQFETMGWTKTADTGQIDWTTVLAPAAANTIMGYEIRSNGTLTMKVSYGSAVSYAYSKSLSFQFGPGSDGAGAITSPYGLETKLNTAIGYSGGSARAGDDYMSGDSTRFSIALTDDTNAAYGLSCSLEPSLDVDGDPDGIGYFFSRVQHNAIGGTRLHSNYYGVEEALGTIRLQRAIGSAGVYVPVSPILSAHPINGVSVLRNAIMVPTALVAHQATLTIDGVTYLSGYGNVSNSTVWACAPAYACSFMMRYD